MADEHRKIEPRLPVAGTGMASDPERIETLQHDYERRVRASKPREGPNFGSVLEHAPAFDPDEDARENAETQEDEHRVRGASGKGDVDLGERAEGDEDAESGASAEADVDKPKLPKVPPDPRMRALHSAFGAPVAKGVPAAVPAPVDAAESSRSRTDEGRAAKPRKKKEPSSP